MKIMLPRELKMVIRDFSREKGVLNGSMEERINVRSLWKEK